MIVYGIDIPLAEIVLGITIILFFLLFEAIVIIALLVRNLDKIKQVNTLTERMSQLMLQIKKAEIDELSKLKRK